ncbi:MULTISPECIES: flagellar basal body-associated FliL family protein [Rhizobium]|uniref:Flagellar protein FliL n=1 Tax=Rhizobium paranaense TaxID=1650438 RepID=A0A7W8XLA9_9HYPH|nr:MULTISPECIES: flagellar basal body-associated FliL family protein [Rhizobium]MBB5571456.1 flagellar FliL protein [Rhizobium paranaense]PST64590.1 flagellar basal body protein FliL [Rhizobium sp. SEMIA4064]
MAAAEASEKSKGSPLIMMIIGLVILTALGAGGGWFLGHMVAPQIKTATAAVQAAPQAPTGEKQAAAAAGANGIVQLEPITTNLAYPSQNWIRLEIALMFKDKPDQQLAEAIHEDILAYVRTVSLQQVEGPRGFQYLRDDIQERVDLRSEGRVSKVMFRTFVIE